MPRDEIHILQGKYRKDIDGLRAIAVLLVIFDHLHTGFPGGYIGVDVFFVISGYLISSTILAEMYAGKFRISNFYERRIRRIFPALFVVLLAVELIACRYFLPYELIALSHATLAALFSFSNMLFWSQAGYFAVVSALKPLLHTWSLAVEEQFYIFFPLFLMLVLRWFPRRLKAAVWTVTGITFLAASIWAVRDPNGAFFLAPLRAWELLLGAVLSQRYLPAIERPVSRNLAAIAGVLLIVVPALVYTSRTSFPGLTALPPCLGAALVIASGEFGPTLVGSILSWRPIAFIGLISYSLYLWHWPILVFQNTSSMLVNAPQGSVTSRLAVFVASLVVATLSWRFIETPFRKGRLRPGRRSLFIVSAAATALLVIVSGGLLAAKGLPGRFPPESLQIVDVDTQANYDAYRQGTCFLIPTVPFSGFQPSTCLRPNSAGPQVLLFGDSHAAHLYPGLSRVLPELHLQQATAADCMPLLKEPPVDPGFEQNCNKLLAYMFGDYLLHHKLDTVILAGRWQPEDLPELGRTIAWLKQHGMDVVVVGPFIEYDMPLPHLLAFYERNHAEGVDAHRLTEPQALESQMAALAQNTWKVRYLSLYTDLCGDGVHTIDPTSAAVVAQCPVYAAPGVPLFFDDHHFTVEGSVLLARTIRARRQLP